MKEVTTIDDKSVSVNPLAKAVISENKSGSRTVNGKSLKQKLYAYRRKYGDEEYEKIIKDVDEMPDVDEGVVDK